MNTIIIKTLGCLLLFGTAWLKAPLKQSDKGMSVETFMKKVNKKDTLVLVDFNADWCAPCKQLKPIVEQIAREKKGKAEVLMLDLDENPKLGEYFEINGLPVMMIYKNGRQLWQHEGFMDKTEILRKLNVYE